VARQRKRTSYGCILGWRGIFAFELVLINGDQLEGAAGDIYQVEFSSQKILNKIDQNY
jgi:hypothetical protein